MEKTNSGKASQERGPKAHKGHKKPKLSAADFAMRQKVKKYSRGKIPDVSHIPNTKGLNLRNALHSNAEAIKESAVKAAEVEVLLPAERGCIELDEPHMRTFKLKQTDIINNVDLNTAQKAFDLHLTTFGPYCVNYTRNGRHLLLGGRRGHVATFDCHTQSVGAELNLQQDVHAVHYLHNQTLFAVAQQKYVYVYDSDGVEIHCLKSHINPYALAYLPYHFLLSSIGQQGVLRYQDISTGEAIGAHSTGLGPCRTMAVNPQNAVVHCAHSNGVVTLWSPTVGKSLASLFAHPAPLTGVQVDRQGLYMATTAMNGQMKVWDVRMLKSLHTYTLKHPAQSLAVSDTGLIAVGMGRTVEILQHAFTNPRQSVTYLAHSLAPPPRQYVHGASSGVSSKMSLASSMSIHQLAFRPLEDVLAIGHSHGVQSIIAPGAGEANFDSFESNPFLDSKQRREGEVQSLLNKLQPEMIGLDTGFIGSVESAEHTPALLAEQKSLFSSSKSAHDKEAAPEKNRKRGRNKISAKLKRKQKNVIDEQVAKYREAQEQKEKERKKAEKGEQPAMTGALRRFVK